MKPSIALFQPEIPQNCGAIIRLCTCFNVDLHIIHPCGFNFTNKNLYRSALDYINNAKIIEHDSFEKFNNWQKEQNRRLLLLTTKGKKSAFEIIYEKNDILLFGRETGGVPDYVAALANHKLRIPMRKNSRSLNLAISAGIVLSEALRQVGGFSDLS